MLSTTLRTSAFRARQATLMRGGSHSEKEFNPFPFSTKNKAAVGAGMFLAYGLSLSAPLFICWFQYWKNGSL